MNYYTNQPQDSKEGATNRVGFNLGGPIIQDVLGFRIYGNFNKTDADSTDINRDSITTVTTKTARYGNADVSLCLPDKPALLPTPPMERQGWKV